MLGQIPCSDGYLTSFTPLVNGTLSRLVCSDFCQLKRPLANALSPHNSVSPALDKVSLFLLTMHSCVAS